MLKDGDLVTLQDRYSAYVDLVHGFPTSEMYTLRASWKLHPAKTSVFAVGVTGSGEVYFKSSNGRFLSVWCCYGDLQLIVAYKTVVDEVASFSLIPVNGGVVVKSRDNHFWASVRFGMHRRRMIVAQKGADRYSLFTVKKV